MTRRRDAMHKKSSVDFDASAEDPQLAIIRCVTMLSYPRSISPEQRSMPLASCI